MEKMDIRQLQTIMGMLRDEEHGCPWDRKQSFRSIAPHTLEEVYEVIDAIEQDDHHHLKNELGDLLFQVVFYAQLGREAGLFDFDDIVTEIAGKLLHRHPHVFPEATIASFGQSAGISAEQVEAEWERLKDGERREKEARWQGESGGGKGEPGASVLDDVPLAFPALLRALKLQKRAARTGFDWPGTEGVLAKLREELQELEQALEDGGEEGIQDELGDMLFTLVNLSRHVRQEPEGCLRAANRKFERRFRLLEARVKRDGKDIQALSLDDMEDYWRAVKDECAGRDL